jgi:cell division protein FtsW (lipid II flippase)
MVLAVYVNGTYIFVIACDLLGWKRNCTCCFLFIIIIITIIYICIAVRDQLSKGRCGVVLHIIQIDIVLQLGLEINFITTLVDLQVG